MVFQVELLGYASGDDHLYLVYEYVPNGSLSDHLHDPLKRGTQILCSISFIKLELNFIELVLIVIDILEIEDLILHIIAFDVFRKIYMKNINLTKLIIISILIFMES